MVKISAIPAAPHRPEPLTWADDRLTAAWLGHATVLLNFYGVRILTDPVLESRVGIGRGNIRRTVTGSVPVPANSNDRKRLVSDPFDPVLTSPKRHDRFRVAVVS